MLERARNFVPSEAGSVLLDHPFERARDPNTAALYFIAAFGPSAESLLGASMATTEGVVGTVYRSGESCLVETPEADPNFCARFDETHAYRTRNLLAVPIRIENSVCGVLEMVNRRGGRPFDQRDRALLEIFAAYTSVSIQNLLDARRAGEAARSDDLTGLANDRHFHRRLAQDLEEADEVGGGVALLFMDLDNFKAVNDRHGHLAGSQVLKEVGYLLRRVVRHPGVTLARYGGDEFVLILPKADPDRGDHHGGTRAGGDRQAAVPARPILVVERPGRLRRPAHLLGRGGGLSRPRAARGDLRPPPQPVAARRRPGDVCRQGAPARTG